MRVPTKEDLRKQWKERIEWKKNLIDGVLKTTNVALNKCSPEMMELATRASALIGDRRGTIVSAVDFGELTEKEWIGYLSQSYRQDEKLAELVGKFKLKCKCQIK